MLEIDYVFVKFGVIEDWYNILLLKSVLYLIFGNNQMFMKLKKNG